jgi:photosystem II stability/assembly factor-like uncharacterized protein
MRKVIFITFCLILLFNYGFAQTNWQEITAPPGTSHTRVHFYDDLNGFVIANEKYLYKTTDGATTWTLLDIPIGSSGKIQDLHLFEDNTTMIAVGPNFVEQYGRIFKSTDCGETWEVKYDLPLRYFKGVYFFNESLGWAWADKMYDSYLYKTEDAGETWTEIYTTNKWLRKLFFISENVGWRCSRAGGHIAKTEDGGYTWADQLNVPGINEGMNDIVFLDELVGFAAGDDRSFLKTIDGGENWEFLSSAIDPGILPHASESDWAVKDIHFINENEGWIIGGPC